jgi:hypothetical protein
MLALFWGEVNRLGASVLTRVRSFPPARQAASDRDAIQPTGRRSFSSVVQTGFYVAGAILQFIGIIFVAALDLFRWLERAAVWTAERLRRTIRRAFRRLPRRVRNYLEASAGTLGTAGALATQHVRTTGTSIDEQVDFLLRRDKATQEAISRINERLDKTGEAVATGFDALRDESRSELATAIASAQADFRRARIFGAVALTVGLGLSTAAAFLG